MLSLQPDIQCLLRTTAETLLNWIRGEVASDWEYGIARVWKHDWPCEEYTYHGVRLYIVIPKSSLDSDSGITKGWIDDMVSYSHDTVVVKDAARLKIYDRPPDHVKVVGNCLDVPEVATNFHAFWEAMIKEFDGRPIKPTSLQNDADKDKPAWFPKGDNTRERWKRAYTVIVETDEKYREAYDEGYTDDPKPKSDDYRDALASEMNWKPSAKTVSKIQKAGKMGLLD
jgi:hypothetical protein